MIHPCLYDIGSVCSKLTPQAGKRPKDIHTVSHIQCSNRDAQFPQILAHLAKLCERNDAVAVIRASAMRGNQPLEHQLGTADVQPDNDMGDPHFSCASNQA
jgi:hypothetical protein